MAYKIFLTSYGANASSDNLHPSVAGGNWIEVAQYEKEDDAKKAAQSLSVTQTGAIPGSSSGVMTLAVVVKSSA